MTREDSLAALYRAIYERLDGASPIWENRVFPDDVDTGVTRPYVVYFFVAGGESNQVKNQDANYIVTAKVVAGNDDQSVDHMQQAMDGAARISELLNDQGEQDGGPNPMDGGPQWVIRTVTQDRRVHVKDRFSTAAPIYHEGHQYRVSMEAR